MLSSLKSWRLFSLSSEQLEYLWLILLATAVGVLAALGNLGFRELIDGCSWVLLEREAGLLRIPLGLPWSLLLPLVLMSGGVVLLLLERLSPGDVLGYGFSNFLRMIHFGSARIKRRWIFLKAAGSALALGAGASVGREGPIAQIGGAIGSAIAQATRLSHERSKVLIACGAGAGIATTFNAPLGGLLFAQEIVLLGETELSNLSLLVISTASGVVTSREILGNAAVLPAHFVLHGYWELSFYALLGIFIGLASVAYIRLFYVMADFFHNLTSSTALRIFAGLFVVGLIAIPLRDNLSDGYPVIVRAMSGNLPFDLMAALFVAKFLASTISLACGAPGGVFGPVFFIGAMAGGAFYGGLHAIVPHLFAPEMRGSYSVVGLGAFLAGTTHAPLTAIFLLTEMTGSYTATLAALISSVLALVVARSIESESIDTYALAREGFSLEADKGRMVLTGATVRSVVKGEPVTVDAGATLAGVFQVAASSTQDVLPVLDGEGDYVGAIASRDLVGLLTYDSDLRGLVVAQDLSRPNFPCVPADANLEEALHVMEDELIGTLPVVDPDRPHELLGLISRQDIAAVFSRSTGSVGLFPSRGTHIFWSSGFRVARIRIPPRADGKSLRDLGTRVRFGVNVLAVQRGTDPSEGFALLEADQPLHTGDVVIAAGRSAGIRAFERELHGD